MLHKSEPVLYIIIPCYNEQEVLPITAPLFLQKISNLAAAGKVSPDSRVLFVNDGSKDKTWDIICNLAQQDSHYIGISQSRNRGHQKRCAGRADGGEGPVRHHHLHRLRRAG